MPRKNSVCQSCQARHLKCVREEASIQCHRCKQENLPCDQDSSLRVRNGLSISNCKRKHLDFDEDQVWVPVPALLSFATPEEQGGGSISFDDEPSELQVETPQRGQSELPSPSDTWSTLDSYHQHEQTPGTQPQQRDEYLLGSLNSMRSASSSWCEQTMRQQGEARLLSSPLERPNTSQDSDHQYHELTSTSMVFNPVSTSSPATQKSTNTPWPFESKHEAKLFLHFVNRLSLWLDGLDSERHFGTEVSRRAAHVPVLMNAILASAARHMSWITGTPDTISEKFHQKCLQILIPVLDNTSDILDENFCAAIIILRQYEEYDESDARCHLFGSTRMVNSIPPNMAPSSLRDSTNWVALRQEIHISLTNKQPVSIMLETYRQSPTLRSDTEDGWANQIVLIFAKVLNYAFRSEDIEPEDTWSSLQDQVEAWNATKPVHFEPLWIENPSEQPQSTFPDAIMLGKAQINGMQYLCMAKILLAAYDPRLLKLGFDGRKLRKESENIVLQNVRMVVGLAASNPHVEIAFMHASHILSACGGYFTDTYEQDAIVKFLEGIEERRLWPTSSIIVRLQEQWK